MTFLDPEIEGLLGEPLAALLFTCIGVPTYQNKSGGMPREPVAIVTPTAGETPRLPLRSGEPGPRSRRGAPARPRPRVCDMYRRRPKARDLKPKLTSLRRSRDPIGRWQAALSRSR
jgi:hypothetical protein